MHHGIKYRHIEINGIRTFYREAGAEHAPVVLLPHGYPSSSFQYRNFIPALSDRWRLIAPDFPGFGYSDTPDRSHFAYTFDGYADFLEQFTAAMKLTRYALYLAARAYLRDLPEAELHLVDGGHWALETNLDKIVALSRDFLGRVHG
jgi:alpha-beta hydrolase superfamily lysophospholipase